MSYPTEKVTHPQLQVNLPSLSTLAHRMITSHKHGVIRAENVPDRDSYAERTIILNGISNLLPGLTTSLNQQELLRRTGMTDEERGESFLISRRGYNDT